MGGNDGLFAYCKPPGRIVGPMTGLGLRKDVQKILRIKTIPSISRAIDVLRELDIVVFREDRENQATHVRLPDYLDVRD